MALTRDFKETVAARVQSDPAFAQALLDAQAVLDEALAPGGAAAAAIVVLRAVEHTVHGEEVAGDLGVGVRIQLDGLRLAHQQCHAQADRLAQAAVFQCVLHCYCPHLG